MDPSFLDEETIMKRIIYKEKPDLKSLAQNKNGPLDEKEIKDIFSNSKQYFLNSS